MRETAPNDRDRGLRRLRRATSLTVAAAGALVAAFAGLAARSLPGHHTVTTVRARAPRSVQHHARPTPPPLVPAQAAVPPAAPPAPPVPTQAPPVAVSGGS